MRGNFTNKTLTILTLVLLTTLFASGCRKRVVSPLQDPSSVRFSIVSSALEQKQVAGSRAVTDINNDFTSESQIGIYATKSDEIDVKLALPQNTNIGYSNPTGSTQWSVIVPGSEIKFLDQDQTMNFFAYHPYVAQTGSSVVMDLTAESPTLLYTLPQNQSTLQTLTVADLMWGNKFGIAESSGVVNLEFEHKLSKLSFTINAGSDWGTEELSLSRIEVKGSDMAATAKLNISSGNLTEGSESNTAVRCDFNPAIAIDVLNARECQFIMIPSELTDLELILTIKGSVTGEKVYNATLWDVELKPGHLRQITMSIFKTSSLSVILSPTIKPWEVISDISMEAI